MARTALDPRAFNAGSRHKRCGMDSMNQRGESPLTEPLMKLRESNPEEVARKAGARWESAVGDVVLPVLSGEVRVRFPEVHIEAPRGLDSFSLKLLTLLYLCNTDGAAPSGQWLAYRDLPGGRFYEPVVNRSVEAPIARQFGENVAGFLEACAGAGGVDASFGDASSQFALFPKVHIAFILWQNDREFPARAQALFDSNSAHHLNAFDLRMGAQEISSMIVKLPTGEGS